MPLNEKIVGKKYPASSPVKISAHESIYYALACNEDNDAYFDDRRPGGIITPPMYVTYYGLGPLIQLSGDKETGLNFPMMVHYSQLFEWYKPVRPGDMISTHGEITKVETREKGGILGYGGQSLNQEGELVVRAEGELYDRSAGSGVPGDYGEEIIEPGEILWTQEMKVKNGQTYIYAEPSGDHNSIHVDDVFAKKVGLPGIILQGLCTMAFTHKMAVDNFTGPEKNPLRIKKLYVRFSRPVFPGQMLRFQGFKIDETSEGVRCGILAMNEEGMEVLNNTWCLVV